MSAEILRRAASLMRERAEAAYASPWRADDAHVWTDQDEAHGDGPTVYINGGTYANQRRTARHIASWHPAVALAVAKLLDDQAALIDEHGAAFFDVEAMGDANALDLARTYLGEPA